MFGLMVFKGLNVKCVIRNSSSLVVFPQERPVSASLKLSYMIHDFMMHGFHWTERGWRKVSN